MKKVTWTVSSPVEDEIKKYRSDYHFFSQYNISEYKVKNELTKFIKDWMPYHNTISKGQSISEYDRDFPRLNRETEAFFKNHFSEQVYKYFTTIPANPRLKKIESSNQTDEQKAIAIGLVEMSELLFDAKNKKQKIREIEHKFQTLRYMTECIKDYGLHKKIQQRSISQHARYSILIEHRKNSKRKKTEKVLASSLSIIKAEFIDPYLQKGGIFIGGIHLTHDSIQKINVFRTLFTDAEIELYKEKNKLRTDLNLIQSFEDVTSEFITTSAVNAAFKLGDSIKDLIHPHLWEKVENLIKNREFSKAVLTAQIELNSIIKKEFKIETGKELDGVSLMRQAFKENDPIFTLTDELNSDNGQSIQDGYKQLFAGSMRAFRNPNAHENLSTNLKDAVEKLIIASHLLKKFENRF